MTARWLFTALLVGLTLHDGLYRRAPNLVVLPLMGGGLALVLAQAFGGRLPAEVLGLIAATWLVALVGWRWNVFGGGDVKLVAALVLYFPDLRFILWLLLGLLVGQTATLLYSGSWRGLRRVAALAYTLWTTRQIPTPEDVRATSAILGQGRITFAIALGTLFYLWLA